MNILFVSESMPGDVGCGGGQRTKLLFDALRTCGDVYCLYFYSSQEPPNNPRFRRCDELMGKTFLRRLLNFIWRYAYHLVMPKMQGWELQYNPFPHTLPIANLFPKIHFNVIVTRYYRMAGVHHLWKYAPLIIDIDDCPLQVYETMVRPGYGRMRRAVSDLLISFVCKHIEKKFSYAWIVSMRQRGYVGPNIRLQILPNIPILPPRHYKRSSCRKMRLLTVGSLAHPPNIHGIDSFLTNVWPRVHEIWPTMEYCIVGGGASRENVCRWNSFPSVTTLGFVEDLCPIYGTALATVVPIECGGGSCIKTLESLAYSCVCLTTPFGARGVDAKMTQDCLHGFYLWSSVDEFVKNLRVIVSGADVDQCANRGRKMIEDFYSKAAFNAGVAALIHEFDKDR